MCSPYAWMIAMVIACTSSCIQLSPFETDLAADERRHNERNQARLDAATPLAGPVRFAAISDSHGNYDGLVDVIDVINARDDIAFVVHLGDMTDTGLREEYRWVLGCLKRLDVPFFTAIGNHDTLSNGVDIYRSMFGPFNYSFRYGSVRVVVANTNYLETASLMPDIPWWQQSTAPDASTTAVIVAAHQQPLADAAQILRDNGVAAVITGHFHRFGVDPTYVVPAVEVGATEDAEWAVVTVEGDVVSVSDCTPSRCAPSVDL